MILLSALLLGLLVSRDFAPAQFTPPGLSAVAPITLSATGQIACPTCGTTTSISPTMQNVVTGTRALSMVFHNTGSTPMFVTVTGHNTVTSSTAIEAFTDSSMTPSTLVAESTVALVGVHTTVVFVVLAGNYYEVACSTTANQILDLWTEWN